MSKKLVSSVFALALAATPLSAFAGMGADENFTIYGWQNWSYEFIDADGGREYDRLSNNAANIGFMAHVDTGIEGLQAGFRCEQFAYFGGNNDLTGWCNRNSKMSLRHETLGEIMFAQWLLPYNEIFAGWVDPFYDADINSHTSIMGHLGGVTSAPGNDSGYYNGSFGNYGGLSFNRRQNGIVQYVWPNTAAMGSQARDGFQFRFAITAGNETDVIRGDATLDPRIWSTGVAWQQNLANGGQVWLAAAYENHEDLSVAAPGNITGGINGVVTNLDPKINPQRDFADTCTDSDDEGIRLAGRYTQDWGNGQKTMLAAMYEELDYEANGCDYSVSGRATGPANLQQTLNPAAAEIGGANSVHHAWTDVERDAWMISGKHMFGNGWDFRFSYMDADEWDCGNELACTSAEEQDTDAKAYNLGVFYTMPAGTELRLTYAEVENEANSYYDFGINPGGASPGQDVEGILFGIVQWFD